MKKILCAAAVAACAAASLMAIESNNIVGFMNRDQFQPEGGADMAIPTFWNCGASGENLSVSLDELKVTGYPAQAGEEGDYEGGCWGQFMIYMLGANGAELYKENKDGDVEMVSYFWWDLPYGDWGDGIRPAGWYDSVDNPLVSEEKAAEMEMDQGMWGDAKAILFTPGQGFRVVTDSAFDVEDPTTGEMVSGLKLIYSGAVKQSATAINGIPGEGAAYATGNLNPTDCTLSRLTVSGYPAQAGEEGDYEGGCWGQFTIYMLGANGAELYKENKDGDVEMVSYFWWDLPYGDWGDGIRPAGWYDSVDNPLVSEEKAAEMEMDQGMWGDAAQIKLLAGKGFRVITDSAFDVEDPESGALVSSLKLEFPSPMATPSAE